MFKRGINAYQKGNIKQQVAQADPHQITLMLMQGALDKMAYAKGCMERKDFEGKSVHLSKASAIIVNLRDTLDFSVESEVTDNLFALYDFMVNRLTDAHVQNSQSIIDEVISLMLPIKTAWASIPEEAKQQAYEMQRQKQQSAV
ncbi:flagellar protein FliS [Catenovulum agarivorans DS-2]|uniref:Flagellar secretion chaperone FliS n=1 Tax=Catenovulum agarivorans DS-2 TaxID=1328313 RepID=W7QBT6_9ALTE|nr:flagellar export chaperone FliS [Catenovulum agarivorans]EWH09466.1 flagellar protein FliS [Catenovulum agarivorans DS-2]